MSKSVSDSLKQADAYPVGIVVDVMFDAFTARLTALPDDHIRFHIAEGPYAGIVTRTWWQQPGPSRSINKCRRSHMPDISIRRQ